MEGAGEGSAGEIARLRAQRGEDAGAASFPALAEAHRRAGDAKRAEQVAREGLERDPESPAGRLALGLALLDSGALEEARSELERVLERVADHPRARAALAEAGAPAPAAPAEGGEPLSEIADDELESAFEGAEARSEEMVDANHLAEAAMRSVEGEASEAAARPEAGAPSEPQDEGAEGAYATGSPFATRTMAGLLERQGYGDEARRLRDSLEAQSAPAAPAAERADDTPEPAPGAARKARALAVLERWLAYLRRASR